MGKALNSSPKANFRRKQRGHNLSFSPGGDGKWGTGDGLKGDTICDIKKELKGATKAPSHTGRGLDPSTSTLTGPPGGGLCREGQEAGPRPCHEQQVIV